jgi:hypothetical protein
MSNNYYLLIAFIIGSLLSGVITRYFYVREYKKLQEELFDLFVRLPLANKKILTTPVFNKRVRRIFNQLRPRLVNERQEDIKND